MTPATSVSFFRPEFDDFLYAPVGADSNEMPLSVLSALARLNVDPWEEAAELTPLCPSLPSGVRPAPATCARANSAVHHLQNAVAHFLNVGERK